MRKMKATALHSSDDSWRPPRGPNEANANSSSSKPGEADALHNCAKVFTRELNVRKSLIVALKLAAPQKPTIDMARVEALHNEGKPKKEIAKALGVDYHKILALGLPNLPNRQPKPIDEDRAQALRAGSLSIKDIAREEGVDRNRIDALKWPAFGVANAIAW